MARRPIGHESAVARRVAAAGSRRVGLLPAGRTAARDFRTGRMDTTAQWEVLLAALAQRHGTPAGITPAGHSGTAVEVGAGTPRRMAHGGERADADRVVECAVAAVRVCDAIGSCGAKLRPPGSTAGYGKPYVRWCGRVTGPGIPATRPDWVLFDWRGLGEIRDSVRGRWPSDVDLDGSGEIGSVW